MIRLDGVGWTYPHAETPSVHDVDLRVRPGEFVVLCGASGSGKSTVLRLINGLVPHFHDGGTLRGRVLLDGLDTATSEIDEIGLRTGTVMQHPRRQFFTDSVAAELAFAMENFGFPPAAIRARVADLMAGLAPSVPLRTPLQRLSGGQQQQVAIAAATAHRPPVLLLDEPSANLSADAVERLRRTLETHRARGATIVVAEHRLRYLEHLADRIVVMRDGTNHDEWSADRFRALTDRDLAEHGLRGSVAPVDLPRVPACGASVLGSVSGSGPEDLLPAEAPAGALELEVVRCRIGGRTVLDLSRASFPAGAVTAIRGANGAGKSTLARVVTGLQRSVGTVRLDGRRLSARARQRASAVVMQDVQRQLFSHTVSGEVDLAALDAADPPATEDVLGGLDLAHLAQRHPLSLSGGQQRLVVATVRLAGRAVVVFDEPSSGIDRRHLESVSAQIRAVAAAGAVVLLISHDEDLLALAADRQLLLARPDPAEGTGRPKTPPTPPPAT